MPAIKISAYCMSVISLIVSIVIFEQGLLYQIVYKIFCLFGTISLFNILASLLAHNKYRDYKLTKFSGASFFIFAMHIFVLGIIVPVLNFAYFFLFKGNILTVVGVKTLGICFYIIKRYWLFRYSNSNCNLMYRNIYIIEEIITGFHF